MIPALVCALLVASLAVALREALAVGRRGAVVRRLAAGGQEGGAGPAGGPAGHRGPARRAPVLSAPNRVAPALAAAGLDLAPDVAFTAWCAFVPVVAGVTALAAGPAVAAAGGGAAAVGPWLFVRSRRGRGDARVEAGLPAALEAVARALRSGASLRQAVEEAAERTPGPLGAELSRVATQARRGAPLVRALEGLADRRPLPGVRLAVAALCLGAETGGAQARAVDGVAATLRDRLGVLAEVRALSSQARISAVVISLAPLGFGAFAAATDPRTATFLFHTGGGFVLLTAGGALDGLGWVWMNRLSRVTA
ncbi:MAG: type II secretion system F family protein [Acidimicrobiales bacterium]